MQRHLPHTDQVYPMTPELRTHPKYTFKVVSLDEVILDLSGTHRRIAVTAERLDEFGLSEIKCFVLPGTEPIIGQELEVTIAW